MDHRVARGRGEVLVAACWIVASGAALIALVGPMFARSFIREKPYEESAFLLALQQRQPAGSESAVVWTEHGPAAYLLFDGVCALANDVDRGLLRLVNAVLYFGAFLVLGGFLSSGAARAGAASARPAKVACGITVALATFASTLLLVNAARVGAEALTYLAFVALLWSASRSIEAPSPLAWLSAALSSLVVAWAHAYGPLLAFCVLVPAAALAAWRQSGTRRPDGDWRYAACVLPAIAVGIALTLFAGFSSVQTRYESLVGHYWATPLSGDEGYFPLASLWSASSSVFVGRQWIEEALQATAVVAALLGVFVPGMPARTRLCGAAMLLSVTGLVLGDKWIEGDLAIQSFFGCHWILAVSAIYTTARSLLGKEAPLLVAVLASLVFTVPALIATTAPALRGDQMLREAAAHIAEMAEGADVVLFAGSRTYVLFAPDLPPEVLDKSAVYFREGMSPDIFTGRTLVPRERRKSLSDLPALAGQRIVYVQLEAAQTVRLDFSSWAREDYELMYHPCNSLGEIYIARFTGNADK